MTVAASIIPETDRGDGATFLRAEDIEVVAFSVMGLWVLASAIPDALYWITVAYGVAVAEFEAGFEPDQVGSMVSTVAELAIGFCLLVGTNIEYRAARPGALVDSNTDCASLGPGTSFRIDGQTVLIVARIPTMRDSPRLSQTVRAKMKTSRTTIGDRLMQALVAGMAAGVTLAIYFLAIMFLDARGAGGIEVSAWFAKIAFSKWGLVFIGFATLGGFFLSPERVADGFSFIWGTHPFWEEAEEWRRDHVTPGWIAFFLVIVAAIVIWWQFY